VKKIALLFLPFLLFASPLREGVVAYKKGDYHKALKEFQQAINEDDSILANYFIGILYLKGLGTTKNLDKAEIYLKKASQKGNIRAQCALAEVYLEKKEKPQKIQRLIQEGIKHNLQECIQIQKKINKDR